MRVLVSSTFAFTICFAVWMIFAVLGIPIKQQLGLSETEFGLLAAMPVLTGSLVRVPLGIWTDRYGGRPVFFVLMLLAVVPIWLLSYATEYWHFLVLALFVGLTGGSFSVGTPYVARWFPRNKQGLAMGVFGAGNSGSAITKFVAPALIACRRRLGHRAAGVRGGAAGDGGAVLAVFVVRSGASRHRRRQPEGTVRHAQDPRVWRYCQYYSVVFGGYVALALWMTKYYIGEYGFDMKLAALLAACFSLPGGVLRAVGGWISDRYGAYKTTWWVMWVCWVAFFLLSYPQTQFTIMTAAGPRSFEIALGPIPFTVLLFVVGIAMAVGKASVFKFISDEFGQNIGAVSGIVGLAGGLGGFILPILFGVLLDLTGVRSSAFMLLYGTVCVSLIFMHFSFRPESAAIARRQPA